ncbi:MAG: peptide/nickel transport system substrate-binding protein, partial [Rubritalea sp.]
MKPFDKLVAQVNTGEISRRDFIQRVGALGLATAIPSALFSNAAYAAPKRGGHLRVATVNGSSTDSLDPTKLTSGMINFMQCTMHANLTEIMPDGQIAPYLAESYEPG